MNKVLFTIATLMIAIFSLAQESTMYQLQNQDRLIFDRGLGDTVFVQKEHVDPQLIKQGNCIKKDSTVCRELLGTLIIPENFGKVVLDTLFNHYCEKCRKDKSVLEECINFYDIIENEKGYAYFWNMRGGQEIIFNNTIVRSHRLKDFFTKRHGTHAMLILSVSNEGVVDVRYKIEPIVENLFCLPVIIILLFLIFLRIYLFEVLGIKYFKIELLSIKDNWKDLLLASTIGGVVFAFISAWINGLGGRYHGSVSDGIIYDIEGIKIWEGISFWWYLLACVGFFMVVSFLSLFIVNLVRYIRHDKNMNYTV